MLNPCYYKVKIALKNIVHQRERLKDTILIVDDNKLCRQLFLDILSEDYTLIEAENGQHAINIINETPPSLIITDINMPVMNGLQMLEKIAISKITEHIPVLVVSSITEEYKAREGLKLGALDYITKPFDIFTLNQKVRNILKLIARQNCVNEQSVVTEDVGNALLTPKQLFNKKLSSVLNQNYADSLFSIGKLASLMAVSERQLQRKCNDFYGNGPSLCLKNFRLNKAKLFLHRGMSITQTAELSGFDTPSYFSRCFRKAFQVSPKKFAQQNTNT
jgi:YesN/AraC family two-component response regulator